MIFKVILAVFIGILSYFAIVYQIHKKKVQHLNGHNQFWSFVDVFYPLLMSPLLFRYPWITDYLGIHRYRFEDFFEKYTLKNGMHGFATAESYGIVVGDAEIAKEILGNKNVFVKPTRVYQVLNLFGPTLISTEGEEWRRHRVVSNPGFSTANMRLVAEGSGLLTKLAVTKWKEMLKEQGKTSIEISPEYYTCKIALAVICYAGFGIRKIDDAFDEKPADTNDLKWAVRAVTTNLVTRLALPKIAFKLFPFGPIKSAGLAFDQFEKLSMELILKRQEKGSDGQHNDLLSLLANSLQEGMKLTPQEVLSDMFIFLFAGHESTAKTMFFGLWELAKNPEAQEKAYEEAKRVFGDRDPTYEDYSSLVYNKGVYKEALRLYPPTFIPRGTVEEAELFGQKIPAYSEIFISPKLIHRNPKYWPDPHTFKPERWVQPNPDQPTYSFLPFSLGPRICIGNKFSQIEGTIVSAVFVRYFKFSVPNPAPEIRMNHVLTLGMEQFPNLVIEARD